MFAKIGLTTPRTQKITSVLSAYWGTDRCAQCGPCGGSHTFSKSLCRLAIRAAKFAYVSRTPQSTVWVNFPHLKNSLDS